MIRKIEITHPYYKTFRLKPYYKGYRVHSLKHYKNREDLDEAFLLEIDKLTKRESELSWDAWEVRNIYYRPRGVHKYGRKKLNHFRTILKRYRRSLKRIGVNLQCQF